MTINLNTIVIYSDVNVDVLDDGPFELALNEDAVRKSLETVFTTPYGSRPFRRRFGSKLMDLLYEPVDRETALRMETMLRETAKMWEERISEPHVVVLPDPEYQRYYVELSYTIPQLGNKMVNYKFNISR